MDDIPDLNIFMMCRTLNRAALRPLPAPYRARTLRRDELDWFKAMPFDGVMTAADRTFMDEFFRATYGGKEDAFYARMLVIADELDRPIATCGLWRAYDAFEAIHWLKTEKSHEGRGLGRALLSILLEDVSADRYPIFLHTQPGSYRAIKLYSDFGFDLLSGERIGPRVNHLAECLPILERVMPPADFARLRISAPPASFLAALEGRTHHEL